MMNFNFQIFELNTKFNFDAVFSNWVILNKKKENH